MIRLCAVLAAILLSAAPAAAQDGAEIGQMRLYIQQLEQQVRQLTGQNEQLSYELNQLRGQSGPAAAQPPVGQPAPGGLAAAQPVDPGMGAPPQDLGTLSVAPDDPLIAPDGIGGDPMDLSDLAAEDPAPGGDLGAPAAPALPDAGAAQSAAPGGAVAALSGSPRDEYDLAYGYILTGDYALAERSFENWLAAFPDEPQAPDARFWLGETQYAQKNFRQAANSYLALYKAAPQSAKAPDALFKLGVSLAALGEKKAACATFVEVGKKYPEASAALKSRVDDESERADCS